MSRFRALFPLVIIITMLTPAGHAVRVTAGASQIETSAASPPSLAAGGGHSLAVTAAGQVWAWGDNRVGQLGTGDQTSRPAPVPVGGLMGPYVAVGAGLGHSLALHTNGSVWAWGLNSDGQLGDGTQASRVAPVQVSVLTDVVAIAAGGAHSLALARDGSVWAWGRNTDGQLGDGTTTRRTQPVFVSGLSNVIAIAAGAGHSLALRQDGTVWSWGANAVGQLGDSTTTRRRTPVQVLTVTTVRAMAAGGAHSLAVTTEGALWAWGWNASGQLGDGTQTSRSTPVLVQGVAPVGAVAAGGAHSLAITASGALVAWGSNRTGQLGEGTTTDRLTPAVVAPPPASVRALAAGGVHTLALAADQSAWSWGNNFFGQLGEGSTVTRLRPVPISGPDLAWGVAPPTFTPGAGVYSIPVSVLVSTVTPDATIHYTTTGTDPTESDPVIASGGSIPIDRTTVLKARAWRTGLTPSAVTMATYVMMVATPVFAPDGGTYASVQTVTVSTATPGAEIRYTTDGTDPTDTSTAYTGPIPIETSTTLKARAFRAGWEPSAVTSATYALNFGTLAPPVAAPPGGTYTQAQSVTLSAESGATIRYTLDGSDPDETSTAYTGPIAIAATTTLKAAAFRVDYTTSAILTHLYEIGGSTGLPPDPSTVAPPVDETQVTDFAEANAFLYAGSNPIQRDVASGAIVPDRLAVVRGLVRDRSGTPLGGVRISVLGQAALGHTLTRADGMFDFALNGGGPMTLDYAKDGFLPAQRTVTVPWNEFVWAPDVVLTVLDSQVTVVTLDSQAPAQVARASVVTDDAGARQATLIVPEGGVRANMTLPDGTLIPLLSKLSIRATEYTVGANGPAAMPAALPATSGYTYAVELSADEALLAGATMVSFDRPLAFYVENFLGLPVGGAVPSGYYDRARAEWVAGANGRIVGIVAVTGGLAELDINGDGNADSPAALAALGVTEGERQRLAATYQAGQSLWRVPIPHFTPWDHNWPYAPPPDAEPPRLTPPRINDHTNNSCETGGSIIECENQVLGERIAVAGTPFTLNYRSNRQPGRSSALSAKIPLAGDSVSPSLKRIDAEMVVAGQRFVLSVAPAAGASATLDWDGRDAYGRPVYGSQMASITVKHVYDAVYTEPAQFAQAFGLPGGATLTADRSRAEIALEEASNFPILSAVPPSANVGGWSLDVHHLFDRTGKTLWFGDGGRRDAEASTYEVKSWGRNQFSSEVRLVGAAPDGSAIVNNFELGLRRLGRDESEAQFRINGLPSACLGPNSGRALGIAAGSGERLYYAQANVAFGGSGQATTLCVGEVQSNFQARQLAMITLPQPQNGGVGRIAIDKSGMIYASSGRYLYEMPPSGEPVLTYTAPTSINGIAAAPDGSLYIAISASNAPGHIYRRAPSGQLVHVAGTDSGACFNPRVEGPLDPNAVVCPQAIAAPRDGGVVFVDRDQAGTAVRRLWPDGFVTTIARSLGALDRLAMGPRDEIYASDNRLRRIVEANDAGVTGTPLISSTDGTEVYDFAASGRHIRTIDAATRVVRYTFGYNALGRLISVTDRAGLVTRIERNASQQPTAIVGPFGQTTALQVNNDGYLTSLADPAGGTTLLGYNSAGLLTSLTTPRGHSSTFTYDAAGRLTRDGDPAGGQQTLTRTDLAKGWQVSLENDLGHRQEYRVEELTSGRMTRTRLFPDGTTWTRTPLAEGWEEVARDETRTRVVTALDPRFGRQAEFPSQIVTTLPSGLRRDVTVTRSAQLINAADPLSVRRLDETTEINGRQFTSTFDATARTFTTFTPAGRQSVATLDPQGRMIRLRNGTLTPIDFTYDAQSRIAAITQGTRTITHGYSALGTLATVTDPLMRTVTFAHDAAGRTIRQTRPDGEDIAFEHDESGNVITVTPPGRPVHSFGFSPVDLLERYKPPIGSAVTLSYTTNRRTAEVSRPGGLAHTAIYDTAGRLAQLASTGGNVTFTYHSGTGRTATVSAPGSVVSYTFDGALPTAEEWSGTIAGRVQWAFDTSFRMSSETVAGVSVPFQYDQDGLLTGAGSLTLTRHAVNAFVTSAGVGSVVTTLGYDGFGAQTSRQTTVGGTPLFGVTYMRDAIGRIAQLSETTSAGTRTDAFTYDPAGRLTAVTRNGVPIASYAYDANGNRLSATADGETTSATYDNEDRLVSAGAATYAYNGAGALSTRSDSTTGTTTFTYDAFGNLRSVTLSSGVVVEYLVDGTNRRIGRRVGGVLTSGFLYQGELRPVAEVDATGAVRSRFVYGAAVNVPEYMVHNGVTYRFVTDHLGSVRFVVDAASGSIAQQMDYDPFGRVVLDTNPGFQPFGFAGGLYDELTGLVHFGARDYDAVSGRWISKDPLGFGAGDSNLYAYVLNDPINTVDPTGLCGFDDYLNDAVDFSAGLGDSLLFGFGDDLRSLVGLGGVVDSDSNAYLAGEIASFAVGSGRLAYAAAAKSLRFLGAGEAAARMAVDARNTLKVGFRLGLFPTYRVYSYETRLAEYGSAEGVIQAATRTAPVFNKGGAVVAGGAAVNEADRNR